MGESAPPTTIRAALGLLLRHPWSHLIRRWNWKSALLSAAIRGTIFVVANLPAGREAALRALVVDATARIPLAGFYGTLTQTLRTVEPAWKAQVASMLIVPAIAHTAEIIVHALAGTPAIREGVAMSIGFSALSAAFNLFAMRRGALLVGQQARPLREDLLRLPRLWLEFAIWIPRAVVRLARRQPRPHATGKARRG